MADTIFAAFEDPHHAENAVGALLDRGVPPDDISLILSEDYKEKLATAELGYTQQTIDAGAAGRTMRFDPLGNDLRNSGEVQILGGELGLPDEMGRNPEEVTESTGSMTPLPHGTPEPPVMAGVETGVPSYDSEQAAKHGVTTTTAADTAAGAAKGAGYGLGIGVIATAATLLVPGFGLVIGGGVLASAVGAVIASTGAGAVAGGVVGLLKDQGMPAHQADKCQEIYEDGGAILSVSLRESVSRAEIEDVLAKYGAHLVEGFGYVS